MQNCIRTDETVDIGRARNGQFSKGNKFAVGNPFTKRVASLRQALVNTVSEQDIANIISALIQSAQQGDTAAAKLVLQYTVGHPQNFQSPDHKVSPHLIENQLDILVNEFKTQLAMIKSFGKIPNEFHEDIKNRFINILNSSKI